MSWRVTVAGIVIVMSLVMAGCGRSLTVHTDHMASTLKKGDRITVQRFIFTPSDLRCKIVAFDWTLPGPGGGAKETYLERAFAEAGDVIEIDKGNLVVKDVNPCGRVVPMPKQLPGYTTVSFPYRVKPGEIFVVGDNPANSYDSRYYGGVPRSTVWGELK